MRKGLPDPTPAGRDTIVTKGWLRCCRELTGGCGTSRAVSKHCFPDFFESTEPAFLLRHDSEGSFWLCPFLSGLLNGNHNSASLASSESHGTYLSKMFLLTDLPMFSGLKWRRFQTSWADIYGREINMLRELYRHRTSFCSRIPARHQVVALSQATNALAPRLQQTWARRERTSVTSRAALEGR
jgi:hypothetical protein